MKENSKRKAARRLLSRSGYKSGGHVKKGEKGEAAKDVHKHEAHLHPGKPKTKLKDGGHAHGHKPKHRADKKSRGKPHTQINIINSAHKQAQPVPKPIPVPVPAGGPGPMAGAPPGAPPMPPPDQSGGMAGPGPMGLKRGGRAKGEKRGTASNSQRESLSSQVPPGHFKRGGKTYPITDGAGGGKARLEKKRAYGAKT